MNEDSVAFIAYNQAVEDAQAAIRAATTNADGSEFFSATFINAIARRCSPHVYVNRLAAAATAAYQVEPVSRDLLSAFKELIKWHHMAAKHGGSADEYEWAVCVGYKQIAEDCDAAPVEQLEHDSCSHWREGDSDNCVWCGDDLGPTDETDVNERAR